MSFAAAERLASTLLFEGYVLYPYRRSSLKNQQRWAFGSLYPPAFSARGAGDTSTMQTECLIEGPSPKLRVKVRFLQFVSRDDLETGPAALPWQEAIERQIEPIELAVEDLARATHQVALAISASTSEEHGVRRVQHPITARLSISATREERDLWKVRVLIANHTTADDGERAGALLHALVSTHTLLSCREGRFVSLLEPGVTLQPYVDRCRNEGTWPVLVGDPSRADTMLSSPIILYDYPKVAPESAGDLYDATEIDEILTLRILTLTEEEKRQVSLTDPRARALLQRTQELDEDSILALHGVFRERQDAQVTYLDTRHRQGEAFAAGDRVTLRPRAHGDVLDLALAGEQATIAKVEQDLEGRFLYAVTVDADPGWDLGVHGQPGHRFYFHADELERTP